MRKKTTHKPGLHRKPSDAPTSLTDYHAVLSRQRRHGLPLPANESNLMHIIGLTGGIASGKSTAARYLGTLGAHVIDADKLGHAAYLPGTDAHRQVIDTFGEQVRAADGTIDRKALGAEVFGKPEALAQLTAIVWPEIRRLAEAEIDTTRQARPDTVFVLEAAVLLEAGWDDLVDEVWVVTVERDVAITRATARDGVERAAIEKRIDAQLSNDERRARADRVLSNNGDEAELRRQLDDAWHQLMTTGATGS